MDTPSSSGGQPDGEIPRPTGTADSLIASDSDDLRRRAAAEVLLLFSLFDGALGRVIPITPFDATTIGFIQYLHARNQVNCAIRVLGWQPAYTDADLAFRDVMEFICALGDGIGRGSLANTLFPDAVRSRARLVRMAAQAPDTTDESFAALSGPLRDLAEVCNGNIHDEDVIGQRSDTDGSVEMILTRD